jgi:hypothetical protein
MAWTEIGLRFSVVGLPTPGSGFESQDRYGLVHVALGSDAGLQLTAQARLWANYMPAPGSGFEFGDRLAVAGGFSATTEAAENIAFEIFETNWELNPSWIMSELPDSAEGIMMGVISNFTLQLLGGISLKETDESRRSAVRPDINEFLVSADGFNTINEVISEEETQEVTVHWSLPSEELSTLISVVE